jgi:hypothetical protein
LIPNRGAGAYAHTDETVIEGEVYAYRLEILHEDGRSSWEGPISIAVPLTPRSLAWSNATPNPFDESVTLELAVPARRDVRVRVYDVQGHEVARLQEGALEPGTHRITWAGVARSGRTVAPGVYLVRAEGGGETTVTRVLRIR